MGFYPIFYNSIEYWVEASLPVKWHLLPDAINIPLQQLEDMLDKLPRDRAIVAYCRGPYCVLAHEAAQLPVA